MYQLSARQLRDGFLQGDHSAKEIADYFLGRIERLDPKIKAYLTVLHERTHARALTLDAKRAAGHKLGKLAGVPVTIKDNMHICGEITTCGSKFLTNYYAPFHATVVKLLEEEDAILIGKSNLDEFAMGSSNEHSAFFPTHNPWNLACSPGGSSGGSTAAVAARLSPLALGSDTGGSIRQPASFCGVVGFKPTYGRISRYGLVAFGSSLDQIGPLATTTDDIGLIMEVIGQHCPNDSTSLNVPADDYSQQPNIKGMKIGVPWTFLDELKGPAKEAFTASVETLKELGAEIVDVSLDALHHSIAIYYILATAEASTNLARFDGVRYGVRHPDAKTLDEVYYLSKEAGFGAEVKRRILLGTYVLSAGYQDAYYRKAQKARGVVIEEYRRAFEKADLIALPVSPSPAFEIGSILDPLELYLADLYTIGANLAGLPAISVPAGFSPDNLPLGLQLQGPRMADTTVCQAARAFEKATGFTAKIPEMARS